MNWLQNLYKRLSFHIWYYQKPPWDSGISPPELLSFLENNKPGKALDMGCGTGTNVITLARHGWKATGIDFAPKAIQLARKKASQAGVMADFFVDDAAHLKHVKGTFDLILDMGCFHNLSTDERASYINQLEKFLAPEGAYLLYAFINSEGSQGHGIQEADLRKLGEIMTLVNRQDGTERGIRPSAWFEYRK